MNPSFLNISRLQLKPKKKQKLEIMQMSSENFSVQPFTIEETMIKEQEFKTFHIQTFDTEGKTMIMVAQIADLEHTIQSEIFRLRLYQDKVVRYEKKMSKMEKNISIALQNLTNLEDQIREQLEKEKKIIID